MSQTRKPRITGWKKWLLRMLLIVLGPALIVGLLEGALLLFGYGHATSYWVRSGKGDTYLSNPVFTVPFFGWYLYRTPIPTVVRRDKPENTYRIFVFGGSAAYGSPASAFSFARVLEAMLDDRFPGVRFEVVNTGMVAINSHVVRRIARDCRGLAGDLYIVYLGNNEVVGPYGPGTTFVGYNPSLRAIRASLAVRTTRTGQLLGNVLGAFSGANKPREWQGMEMFIENSVTADDPRLDRTYENFGANLRDICGEARRAGADVILSTVITNLKDLPPFTSVHKIGLSEDDRARWEKLYDEGVQLQGAGRYAEALDRYLAADKIDDAFAELHFRAGRCLFELKRYDEARSHFVQARDLDALRFRADSRINGIIRETAESLKSDGVYLLDAENTVSVPGMPPRIPGAELLYEHVHLKFDGNHALAAAMFRKILPLLPPGIRNSGGSSPEPPSLERCEQLTVYTAHDVYSCRVQINKITGFPPFPEERRAADEAELQRLQVKLTPDELEQVAQAYRDRLRAKPGDVLLWHKFGELETYRGRWPSAAVQFRRGLELYPPGEHLRRGLARSLLKAGQPTEAVPVFRRLLRNTPGDAMAMCDMAMALYQTGKKDEAIKSFHRALTITPRNPDIHLALAAIYVASNDLDKAKASYEDAIRLRPDSADYHAKLAGVLSQQNDLVGAAHSSAEAVRLRPESAELHYVLASMYYQLAIIREAREEYNRAVSLDIRFTQPPYNLGAALAAPNAFTIAVEGLRQTVASRPDDPYLHACLGNALLGAGKIEEAVAQYKEAVRLGPDLKEAVKLGPHMLTAVNNLAWIYATAGSDSLRDGNEAVSLAECASRILGDRNPSALDTLAAAYAEAGRFDEAVATAREALALAEEAKLSTLADRLRVRLELYEARKPYRDPGLK